MRTMSNIARCAMCNVAAPSVWNALPNNIRSCTSTDIFKQHLKTHLFNLLPHSTSVSSVYTFHGAIQMMYGIIVMFIVIIDK